MIELISKAIGSGCSDERRVLINEEEKVNVKTTNRKEGRIRIS